MSTVLIIEDEPKVAKFIQRGLSAEGFVSDIASTGSEGLRMAFEKPYDVITVDLMLPGTDGYSVIQELKSKQSDASILILSAKDTLDDKLKGFRLGSDDYLAKPFAFEELVARINAIIRRRSIANTDPTKITFEDVVIDISSRSVTRGERKVDLTNMEFKLLEYLVRNAGKACSRADIAAAVWQESFDRETNIVDVYMMYLRKKIDHPNELPLIQTVRAVGYMVGSPS
ncbi:MAG TPA: response regulator transcription factor [Candidatus Kapabacteria bacterium]|nr:response regulator transcription factor [Candidatus Kapabacteria bacterium]